MSSLGTILQANNIQRVAEANYEASRDTRIANNKLAAAKGNLANWSRSLGNRRRVQAAEREFNRSIEALVHETKQAGKQVSNMSLQYAEQMGALQAQAAFNGVGGSTVEMMENLVSLQMASSEEEVKQQVEMMSVYGKENAGQIMADSYNSADFSQAIMEFDFAKDIAPKKMKRRLGKLIGVAVATYFGGPMAGEAVADFAVGEWQASNGNFTGAMQQFGQGVQNAGKAWQDYSDRGGSAWGSDVMRGFRASGGGNSKDNYVKVTGTNTKSVKSSSKSWFR